MGATPQRSRERAVAPGADRGRPRGRPQAAPPDSSSDYLGQERVKQTAPPRHRRGQAARRVRSTTCCFFGPPGLGQDDAWPRWSPTRWERQCAPHRARPSSARATSPPSSPTCEEGDVLFVDEIHRLNHARRGGPLLRRWRTSCCDIVIGKGPAARSIRLDIPQFTLVGATTRSGHAHRTSARPLRHQRRGLTTTRPRSWPASCDAFARESWASPIDARRCASRSPGRSRGGRPVWRTACSSACVTMRRCARDGRGERRRWRPWTALTFFEVDELGLDWLDHKILDGPRPVTFAGRPVGLSTLASAVGEDPGTVEDMVRAVPAPAGPHRPHAPRGASPPAAPTSTSASQFPGRRRAWSAGAPRRPRRARPSGGRGSRRLLSWPIQQRLPARP